MPIASSRASVRKGLSPTSLCMYVSLYFSVCVIVVALTRPQQTTRAPLGTILLIIVTVVISGHNIDIIAPN